MNARPLRNDRQIQRYQLARRLTAFEARTHTIGRFTALSRHQLAGLRKRWGVEETDRHRGPSPHSISVFLRSPRLRAEGAGIAALWLATHAPERTRHPFFSVEIGEQLCEVYEIFARCAPESEITFEHMLMIVLALQRGDELALSTCETCEAAILLDRLSTRIPACSLCEPLAATGTNALAQA